MDIYDGLTDAELEARFNDLYQQIMAGLDSLPPATYSGEYKAAKREIRQMEVEFRGIGIELARRLAERTRGLAEQALMRFSYECPCGGALNWNDDTTVVTCEICGTVHENIGSLTMVPDA